MKSAFPLSLIVSALCVAATPAFAKNDHDHGKGKGKDKHHYSEDKDRGRGKHKHRDDDRVLVNIGGYERERLSARLLPHYHAHCPPGLAKKHNGCLPPGQAKKYRVGYVLPSHVHYWPVPGDVLALLPAAPYGASYVWVDRDILLISEATKKVLDAAVLLSAVD